MQAAKDALLKGDEEDPEKRLLGVLDVSLNKLNSAVSREMFLDVVSVLRGQRKEHALALWKQKHDAYTLHRFKALEDFCLVSTDVEGNLQVHDVLQYLGRFKLTDYNAKHESQRFWVSEGKLVPSKVRTWLWPALLRLYHEANYHSACGSERVLHSKPHMIPMPHRAARIASNPTLHP